MINGVLDDDYNVYVYEYDDNGSPNVRRESIGVTITNTAFYNSDYTVTNENGEKVRIGAWVVGAIIDLNDFSGLDFLGFIVSADLPLGTYAINAIPGGLLDYKVTDNSFTSSGKDPYRGMPIGVDSDGNTIISSARDIGNMAAGYEAGSHGLSWNQARYFFDFLQKFQEKRIKSTEGESSKNAQKYGWRQGAKAYKNRKQ